MGILHVKRIEKKLDEIYQGKIDMSDYALKPAIDCKMAFLSRAVAAYSINIFTGAPINSCADAVTDGFGDMGIDAIYNDKEAKVLYFIQSKWINDGNGSPEYGEILKFINGIKRSIRLDFADANAKI